MTDYSLIIGDLLARLKKDKGGGSNLQQVTLRIS